MNNTVHFFLVCFLMLIYNRPFRFSFRWALPCLQQSWWSTRFTTEMDLLDRIRESDILMKNQKRTQNTANCTIYSYTMWTKSFNLSFLYRSQQNIFFSTLRFNHPSFQKLATGKSENCHQYKLSERNTILVNWSWVQLLFESFHISDKDRS